MTDPIKHVVIVGGGAAGWLTAGVLAADHPRDLEPGLKITVVESPAVSPVGVGEGTWPTMRDTLRRIGVSETDFIRECDAAFKQGSRFVDWVSGGPNDHYYHPFVLPQGYAEANLVAGWQRGHAAMAFADLVSFQPHLCENGCAPKQLTTPEYAAVANYGYHLDATKFGQFLQRHCVEKLGVQHVVDHVTSIDSAADGDIDALVTGGHGRIEGDLFIDCSGLSSLLLGQHYGIPMVSQQSVLFADSALAMQVPYADSDAPVACQTISSARPAGWIWDIGLPSRRGIGYVYSSAHTSDAAAEDMLRKYVADTAAAAVAAAGTTRKLTFKPGYRQTFWHRNCVAVGLAAGFIEPLEASALALVELSCAMISDQLPASRAAMDIVARRFNESFRYRWECIIEFLKLHYLLSKRSQSEFWVDHRAPSSVPERLVELLALWRHQPPSRYDFNRSDEIFPSASYQYVLYGMGFRPEPPVVQWRVEDGMLAERFFGEAAARAKAMIGGLPMHRDLLKQLMHHRLQRI